MNQDLVWLGGGIYIIRNLINTKLYVGSAKDFAIRWRSHRRQLRKNIHPSSHLQLAWNQYGESSFEFSCLERVANPTDLIEREQYWIDYFNSANRRRGYNLSPTAGSQLGYRFTEAQRKRLSESHRATRKPHSEETKKKIAAALRNHPSYSDPNRRTNSAALKGRKRGPLSAETRAKISAGRKRNSKRNTIGQNGQFGFDLA